MSGEEKAARYELTLRAVLEHVQQAAQGRPQDWIDIVRSIRRILEDA